MHSCCHNSFIVLNGFDPKLKMIQKPFENEVRKINLENKKGNSLSQLPPILPFRPAGPFPFPLPVIFLLGPAQPELATATASYLLFYAADAPGPRVGALLQPPLSLSRPKQPSSDARAHLRATWEPPPCLGPFKGQRDPAPPSFPPPTPSLSVSLRHRTIAQITTEATFRRFRGPSFQSRPRLVWSRGELPRTPLYVPMLLFSQILVSMAVSASSDELFAAIHGGSRSGLPRGRVLLRGEFIFLSASPRCSPFWKPCTLASVRPTPARSRHRPWRRRRLLP